MVSKNYAKSYGLLFSAPVVHNEPFFFRIFSPSPAQQTRAETEGMLRRAERLYKETTEEERYLNAARIIITTLGEDAPEYLVRPFYDAIRKFEEFEPALFDQPTLGEEHTTIEEMQYRDFIKACVKMHTDRDASLTSYAAIISAALGSLTPLPHREEGIFIGEVPLLSLKEGREVVDLYHAFFVDEDLFKPLKEQLFNNLCSLNGCSPGDNKKLHPPSYFLEKDKDTASVLFAGTPLWDILQTPVPITLPQRLRFEHHHIVAGTGTGKTQTFEHLISLHLPDILEGKANVVVIEPDGALINRLARLEMWRDFPDCLTIIDPKDIEHPIALNMFDVNMSRLSTYSPLVREQTVNGVIELFDYVFGSLLSSELTGKQSTLFRYVVRLMLAIEGANIQTLREIFEPHGLERYRQEANALSGAARHFFATEWDQSEFKQTKSQILRRIWQLLENSTFERMFSHPRSRLDFTGELNSRGRLILINTAQSLLKEEGSALFARLFIALITQCALEREALPHSERVPTFVYIDECSPVVDQKIETILTQARKYNIGLILAHQHLGQLRPESRQALASNTTIKMASGLSHADTAAMARDMRCDPEHIDQMKKGQFATSIKGVTSSATFNVEFGMLDRLPIMTPEEFQGIRQIMRDRYTAPVEPPPPPMPDEDPKPF